MQIKPTDQVATAISEYRRLSNIIARYEDEREEHKNVIRNYMDNNGATEIVDAEGMRLATLKTTIAIVFDQKKYKESHADWQNSQYATMRESTLMKVM